MNTETIIVNNEGQGMKEALSMTEKLGQNQGLSVKEQLHLRLLAEEVFSMMRTITHDVEADYHVEYEGKSFRIFLEAEVDELTREMRKTLLSVSSSGENSAVHGFLSKLKDVIGSVLLPEDEGPSMFSTGLISMGSPSGYHSEGMYEWSMEQYRAAIKAEQGEDAEDAWDELEKSIVANIADDISIFIKKTDVKIEIKKAFT